MTDHPSMAEDTSVVSSQSRGATNVRRGKTAENAVVKWLKANGFPHAERAVRTGFRVAGRSSADHGDITGTPGVVWQVKDVARSSVPAWLRETEAQRVAARADLGVLVLRWRGMPNVAHWWAWLIDGYEPTTSRDRLVLDTVMHLLRRRGYGEPLEDMPGVPDWRSLALKLASAPDPDFSRLTTAEADFLRTEMERAS